MLQCAAVCCSVLQCVAVCCSVLQCVAVCCSVLQCVAVCCSVLQCVAVCCSVLQCVCSTGYITKVPLSFIYVFQGTRKCAAQDTSRDVVLLLCCTCVAVCCSVLQCVAVCCSTGYITVHTCIKEREKKRAYIHANSETAPPLFIALATHCNTLQHTATHCNTLQHKSNTTTTQLQETEKS